MIRSSKKILRERAAALRLNDGAGFSPWIPGAVIFAGLTSLLARTWGDLPVALVFMTVMTAGFIFGVALLGGRSRRLTKLRQNNSICEFARFFDCRTTDTLIIRAVFERFQVWLGAPVHADDDLFEDWQMDGDDFDDAVEEVASLTRRPLAGMKLNPYYGKVCTPGDLVHFFMAQPRIESVSP